MAVEDWVYLTDEGSGFSYYANLATRETSWEAPPELGGATGEEPAPYLKLDNGWFEYKDDRTGRSYYYNLMTQAIASQARKLAPCPRPWPAHHLAWPCGRRPCGSHQQRQTLRRGTTITSLMTISLPMLCATTTTRTWTRPRRTFSSVGSVRPRRCCRRHPAMTRRPRSASGARRRISVQRVG